jgi:hypothetical protein
LNCRFVSLGGPSPPVSVLLQGSPGLEFKPSTNPSTPTRQVDDLFPGLDCPRVRYPRLNDEVEAELGAAGYQVLTAPGDQVDKVVQLYEVMLTRHTTMVVGQTGGGKSVILQTLARAQVGVFRVGSPGMQPCKCLRSPAAAPYPFLTSIRLPL